MTFLVPGPGSILIDAAGSGIPEMVREILRYKPKIDARDQNGRTALFAAGEYRVWDTECVRLLVEAGANVNAQNIGGNTALHETSQIDVEEELLKLGANVNAQNENGETPIFTANEPASIPLFIAHGADLTIRNNKGETVVEAAKGRGARYEDALRMAIAQSGRKP
jgi:ankyrin repeat protein